MAAARYSLTVFMPGLLGPMPALQALRPSDWPDLGGLERFLARAVCTEDGPRSPERGLFQLFDIPIDPDADPPAAAVTRLLDGGAPDEAWWLRADPVYLQVDRDAAVLAAHDRLRLTPDEAARLSAEIASQFVHEGWHLEALHPARWYLSPREVPRLRTHAVGEVLGRDVRSFLPTGEDGRNWHRHLNEIQMLLHASEVNAEREATGKLPVNSLWFWGGGRLPRVDPAVSAGTGRPWTGVWADEPLARGLAALTGAPAAALPDNAQAWLDDAPGAGNHLVYVDDLRLPVVGADPFAWLGALQDVYATWLAPLAEALGRARLETLTLLPGDGRRYRVSRHGFGLLGWRPGRSRALSAYVRGEE